MLAMNYTYRIYPNAVQQAELLDWLETCRGVYNYALRELKDWIASRKCLVDRCLLEKEYIIPANEPFPSYHRQQNNLPKAKKQFLHLSQVHSQVLQTTIRRLQHLGSVSETGTRVPPLQEVWSIQVLLI